MAKKQRRAALATQIFALLERAASEGRRCPTNPEIAAHLQERGDEAVAVGSIPAVLQALVREKRIVVRVYAQNWRDIIICAGQYTGKTTMQPPGGHKPYLVINAAERARRDKEKRRWVKWRLPARH